MKILFAGGGTGGHIMPIISIARELKIKIPEVQLDYMGPKSDFDLLEKEGFKNHPIVSGKMRRYLAWQNFIDLPLKIPFSFLQSFFLLLFIKPDLVFSKGGTGSLPVTYCARLLGIPAFIHESDVAPGLSNKISSKWAKRVFTSFTTIEYFDTKKVVLVGNPIRKELLNGNKEEAKKMFNITSQKPVIFIFGGSQGAGPINDFVLTLLNKILQDYELIHVAGVKNYKILDIKSKATLLDPSLKSSYHLYESLNQVQLKNAYAVCDIIISRAGAGSIFEIAMIGKPSILIPLPSSANNHQAKNAYQYAKSGACIVIEQESLTDSYFIGEIENVIEKSEKMRTSALKFAKPDASEKIAKEIIEELSLQR